MIKNSKLQFTISTKNLIKYGYGLQDNIITFTIPTVNPNIEVNLKVEIESINTFGGDFSKALPDFQERGSQW